ncbi:hypothetical protein A6M27_11400 [Acidithiobacillus thiooxidans]|uniref:Uncharacterized protein n=1 Tax=Acidithiobacillus thiooxidans TaxID=930 RepID=A0A1C2I6W8_ACITH|nr:hypothetical protein A6P07_11510 [Acidithiobacillus thiooxidans]OCX77804.1 hypothetical protein A6O26_19270 [Acidithiobacillus thiooxidans]OCX86899.1 hypothetical protein A6M27_11400 [Acidithiobacillus thiooxidans]OFC49638.1 hypothetical protein BAE47_04760 [Acidithiobacillus thiooxidans]
MVILGTISGLMRFLVNSGIRDGTRSATGTNSRFLHIFDVVLRFLFWHKFAGMGATAKPVAALHWHNIKKTRRKPPSFVSCTAFAFAFF